MGTTKPTRDEQYLGDYLSTFEDSVQVHKDLSLGCAFGRVRSKVPGRYLIRFSDRTVEGGVKGTIIDPDSLTDPGALYAFTHPGSTNCIVWKVVR